MEEVLVKGLGVLLLTQSWVTQDCHGFNVGTVGAKVFTGPAEEQFGYSVQQFSNYQGKWLLVGSPLSGLPSNRKGDIYRCSVSGTGSSCDKLNLQNSVNIPDVKNVNVNMSLGLTLTRTTNDKFMMCGPLWAQQCGNQYFYPGVCGMVTPQFTLLSAFSPAVQTCGGPMDIAIVLDGSNSIYPWPPVVRFLTELIKSLDIGPTTTQVSVLQYGEVVSVEYKLNSYKTKNTMLAAAQKIYQRGGQETRTFTAIQHARQQAFLPINGGRAGATKVMIVVTDGESHDRDMQEGVIAACNTDMITRFGIAVLGYYNREGKDAKDLIAEIKSIASSPPEKYFFNVSDEVALSEIAGTLGDRIFNIEGTGKGGDFNMEFSQVGFSAYQTSKEDALVLGAVGAYGWTGTVVHQAAQKFNILPKNIFESILEDRNHSSYLGYSVSGLTDGSVEYYVAGAPRTKHAGLVVVYTINSKSEPLIIDIQRGTQIGSYFGSVLCPLDVNRDGVTDVLLVGAPMFMTEQKKERGKVYMFSISKGILSDQGSLEGPSQTENARFGMTIAAVPDLNVDGFKDVVVGAPLEDSNHGTIYIYYGDGRTVRLQYSQKILGKAVDQTLQYFGRSADGSGDLNGDNIPDVSVGAHGKVVQLWSRGVAVVTAKATFAPDKINILSKNCHLGGRLVFCFEATVCFSASFRPTPQVGPVAIKYNLTLDADLQSSRVSSRGQFGNSERSLVKDTVVDASQACESHTVYVQDTPDFVNSVTLRVDVALQKQDASPVLDAFAPNAWEFFIPFTKDCGTDEVCECNLALSVVRSGEQSSSSPFVVSPTSRRLSFSISVNNRKENSYNTRVLATFSNNLFYASFTPPSDGTEVKCTSTAESQTLSCQVAYPALKKDQMVMFEVHFDFNLDKLQKEAQVSFEAQSDSKEENPTDNKAPITVPVLYDSQIILTSETNINFYVVDTEDTFKTTVANFSDIGPEFIFTIKATTGNFRAGVVFLNVLLPIKTTQGNPLLYVTGVKTAPDVDVNCDVTKLIDPENISKNPYTLTFSKQSFRGMEELDCKTSTCHTMKCVLKDLGIKREYVVNVTTRLWTGTFASSTFQMVSLIVETNMESNNPDLIMIAHKHFKNEITVSKPGEVGDIPMGVIIGSVLGGLLLLAIAVATLWKLGFFKRQYQQLAKGPEEERENEELQGDAA
ncbi:integrin alpha-2 [Denticeps clupeoides]|nr:integrin alpha-2 [Denticeps clupeoides]